ncbi:DUF7503 family protein [Haloarcula salina]|nr:hypothetical protein [Haloarcula salina]
MSDTTMREYLAEHPKMAGALFTLLMLLTQAGNAAANNNAYFGP